MAEIPVWYRTGDISAIKNIAPEKIICFDTETTGFDYMGEDEILQLSIVRGDGEVLFNEYVKPGNRKRWPKAQEVNNITYAMVKDKPLITEYEQQIRDIFSNAELLVAYNAEFDLNFLFSYFTYHLAENKLIFDVMLEFAPVAAQWNEYRMEWKWQKLTYCARHYSYKFDAHDANEDTKATLHCFWAMLADDKPHHSKDKMVPYLKVVEIHAQSNAERKEKEQAEQAAPKAENLVFSATESNPDNNTRATPVTTQDAKKYAKEQARKKSIESLAAKYPKATLQKLKVIFLVLAIACFLFALATITTIVFCFLFLALGLVCIAWMRKCKSAIELK